MSAWTVIGGSVRGTSHERRSQPCQDAWAWQEISRDPGDHAANYLCVAISDGAGSASHSDLGSQTAVKVAVEAIAQIITAGTDCPDTDPQSPAELERWRSPLQNSFTQVQQTLKNLAQDKEIALRDLACTLLIMVWTPAGIVALQVGDGAIIGREPGGQLIALTQPHQGEYANQTLFVIDERAAEETQFIHWSAPMSHVALFSDGLQRLALELPSGKPFTPFFDPLFTFVDQVHQSQSTSGDRPALLQDATETLEKFLRSPRVISRTDDDLTLALIAGSPGPSKSGKG